MTTLMNIKDLGKARQVGDPTYSVVGRVTSRGVFRPFLFSGFQFPISNFKFQVSL